MGVSRDFSNQHPFIVIYHLSISCHQPTMLTIALKLCLPNGGPPKPSHPPRSAAGHAGHRGHRPSRLHSHPPGHGAAQGGSRWFASNLGGGMYRCIIHLFQSIPGKRMVFMYRFQVYSFFIHQSRE